MHSHFNDYAKMRRTVYAQNVTVDSNRTLVTVMLTAVYSHTHYTNKLNNVTNKMNS